GTTGAAGTGDVITPTYCEAHADANRSLPYDISKDFKVVHVLTNNNSAGYWKVVATPDCSDSPTYPPFTTADAGTDAAPTTDGGTDAVVDASADGGADANDDAQTLSLDDPDAADGGVADAPVDAPVDSPVDAPTTDGGTDAVVVTDGGTDAVVVADGGTDAGPAAPACYEFSYNPDGCTGACWAGVVFQVTDVQGPSPDTKGVCITPGATAVEFWARASKNNVPVKFGSIGEGPGRTEFTLNITTTWAKYTVSVPDSDYNVTSGDMMGVWNAFSVVVEPTSYAGGAYIEVKDINWIKN
ncbi:MAG TPA: hypothetical protein VHK47_08465, partial [Polyangia bacterium]|nr:hypothetical protein [Polyangia bacterium]